jgi:hypothetical protein
MQVDVGKGGVKLAVTKRDRTNYRNATYLKLLLKVKKYTKF